jgi:anti-anti-sigma regulatory factor
MEHPSRRALWLAVDPRQANADIRAVADRLARQGHGETIAEVLVDVSSVRAPTLRIVDALARLHLNARRTKCRVRLIGPCPELRELLALLGLLDVLTARGGTGLELDGESEHGE